MEWECILVKKSAVYKFSYTLVSVKLGSYYLVGSDNFGNLYCFGRHQISAWNLNM